VISNIMQRETVRRVALSGFYEVGELVAGFKEQPKCTDQTCDDSASFERTHVKQGINIYCIALDRCGLVILVGQIQNKLARKSASPRSL